MKPRIIRSLAFVLVASLAALTSTSAQVRPPMPAPSATTLLQVNAPNLDFEAWASPPMPVEHPIARPQASILFKTDRYEPADTTSKRNNPALRGAVIGGSIVGLAAAVYAYHGPFENEKCFGCAVGGFVVGAVVGSVIGGFIGSAIGN